MKKIVIIALIIITALSGLFFTKTKAEQDYLTRKYLNSESYSQIADSRIHDGNIDYFRHLLTKKEELEANGGIQNQLLLAIKYNQPQFIELLSKEYDADINQLIASKPLLINDLLVKGRVSSFDTIMSHLTPSHKKAALEKVLLEEAKHLITTKGKTHTFFDEEGMTLKLLSNTNTSRNDPLLITLLNHGAGLAKDKLVNDILTYGVKPTVTDKSGMSPLQAFFLLTPKSAQEELPKVSQLMQEIRNTPNQDKGISKASIFVDFYARANQAYLAADTPLKVSQQIFFKAHKDAKTNILKDLITHGANPDDYKILGNTPFELLAIFGASDILIPSLKLVKKSNYHELALLAIEDINAPLFMAITKKHKINYKWRNKQKENLLMVLLKYDIVRKKQINSVQETVDLFISQQTANAYGYGAGDSGLMAMTSNYQQKAKNRKEAVARIKSLLKDQRIIAKALLEGGINTNAKTKKGYSVADYLFGSQIAITKSYMIRGDYEYLKDALEDSNLMLDMLVEHGLSTKTKLKFGSYSPVNNFFGSMIRGGRSIGTIKKYIESRQR